MKANWIKVIGLLGALAAGGGVGGGMASTGSNWYEIALSVVGVMLTWLLGSKFAIHYSKLKAVIHAIDDALADDKVTIDEVKAVIEAFKTGKMS